jgi:hypothetical protein
VGQRKLFPGFHPGIYLEQHGVERVGVDHWPTIFAQASLRGWNLLITSERTIGSHAMLRIGLHSRVLPGPRSEI